MCCHGRQCFDQPDVQDNKDRTKAKIAGYTNTYQLDEPHVIWEAEGIRVYGQAFDGLDACGSVTEVINAFWGCQRKGLYRAERLSSTQCSDNFAIDKTSGSGVEEQD